VVGGVVVDFDGDGDLEVVANADTSPSRSLTAFWVAVDVFV
jgi:hypothetical protein